MQKYSFVMPLSADSLCRDAMFFGLSDRRFHTDLVPQYLDYLMNGLSSLSETYSEYSLAVLTTCLDSGG